MANSILLRKNNLKDILDALHEDDNMINFNTNNFLDNSSNDTRTKLNKNEKNLMEIIDNLKGNLTYLGSGSSGHNFKCSFNKNNREYSFVIKIVPYEKTEKNVFNTTSPENVEIMMLKLLSKFVINSITPNLVLPIHNFYTKIKKCINVFKKHEDVDNIKKFLKKYEENKIAPLVSVLFCEWMDKNTLIDFIRKNVKNLKKTDWQIIFFQILSTLAIIHLEYPNFKHNDLKPNNILVSTNPLFLKNKKIINKTITQYINNVEYCYPLYEYNFHLWDFDFASIKNRVDNTKVEADWANNINITSKRNQYYDVHYLFNMLLSDKWFPEYNKIPDDVKNFFDRIIPVKYRITKTAKITGRILTNDEIHTPLSIIENDEFFSDFRKKNTSNINETIKKLLH